jgi:hypothetical protein
MTVPIDWPRKHPNAVILSFEGNEWEVAVDEERYWVTQGSAGDILSNLCDIKITVGRIDGLPIDSHWFGVFVALKKVTTGPETAWRMIIPTESGMRDNLNHYHFELLLKEEAMSASGETRNVAWENESWKEEYE